MKTNIKNYPDLKVAQKRDTNKTVFVNANFDIVSSLKPIVEGDKYFIHTLGCQANVRDEETMRGLLSKVGYISTDNVSEADLIIINTCAVRENAEDKVYGEIGNLKKYRRENKDKIIALCGCMVEQPEILNYLRTTFPEVNLYFGTHEIPNLLDYIFELKKGETRIIDIKSKPGEVIENLPSSRLNKYKAYVNIMYGCNKFCTYCIVPYTRGKERSRKFNDVLLEVRDLKKAGYQEVTLLGQNVNAYGKDLDEGYDFADLLEAVAQIGIPRVRFTTSHPWDFSSKMIDVISKYDNIMKCIHLPVQSGSSEILKRMGRRYDREKYLTLVKEMREKIPNLSLSTDIIVGFPNESEENFNDTLTLCDEVKYENAYTFIYSPRRGTPAAKMEDNVSSKTKSLRFRELVKRLEKYMEIDANNYIGKTCKVLVDGESKTDQNMLSGYSESNKLVHFKGDKNLIGKIVTVKILESHTYSLIGELVNE
ncbi:MAG: tRNA (N6-isopentenyl adenosine(37)-C2)-methylthiotransferase MiaB [Bacilli bacterium]|nr:tRNA (N6-isopentenyl adenosine(37)-C2)-methylthiotransferase MiaB [Bacilli bacterium]